MVKVVLFVKHILKILDVNFLTDHTSELTHYLIDVPLLKRAFQLWRELAELETQLNKSNENSTINQSLLTMTGGIMIGIPTSTLITGTLNSVRTHNLPHEILNSTEIHSKFPFFHPNENEIGIYETEAGYLIPEQCIDIHLKLVKLLNIQLKYNELMISFIELNNILNNNIIIKVITNNNIYYTKKLILSVGAWAPEVYGSEINLKLIVERRVLYWIEPENHENEKSINEIENESENSLKVSEISDILLIIINMNENTLELFFQSNFYDLFYI